MIAYVKGSTPGETASDVCTCRLGDLCECLQPSDTSAREISFSRLKCADGIPGIDVYYCPRECAEMEFCDQGGAPATLAFPTDFFVNGVRISASTKSEFMAQFTSATSGAFWPFLNVSAQDLTLMKMDPCNECGWDRDFPPGNKIVLAPFTALREPAAVEGIEQ